MKKAVIEWNYTGKPDYSFGTGAYGTERALGWAASLIIPLYVVYLYISGMVEWNVVQTVVAFVIAFDISGGLVCNALNSCKRFYHSPLREGDGKFAFFFKNHLLFSLLHIHPIVVSLLYGNGVWLDGFIWYGLFLISVMIVIKTPLYLRRPVAMGIIMVAVLLNNGILASVQGFEWLIPLLFIKIIYGHLVREEPYRKEEG